MVATTLTFAAAALLFLQARALEYKAYNISYCPEIPDERAFLVEVHSRIKDDQQEFTGNETMLKDFGNDNTFLLEVYRILEDKEVRLLNYKGKRACDMLVQYGGAAYLKVAKMANVENPGKCPVVKKDYSLDDYFGVSVDEVPVELAALAPKGKFRIKYTLTDTPTGNVDFCCQFFAERY